MNKILFTYEEFQKAKSSIIKQIEESNIQYDYIVANLRGGFYLADAISRHFKIPLKVVRIALRDSKMMDSSNIQNEYDKDKMYFGESRFKYLFVDDLIDSGQSIKQLDHLWNVDVAVLLRKPEVKINNKVIYYKELENNSWIDFFWEVY